MVSTRWTEKEYEYGYDYNSEELEAEMELVFVDHSGNIENVSYLSESDKKSIAQRDDSSYAIFLDVYPEHGQPHEKIIEPTVSNVEEGEKLMKEYAQTHEPDEVLDLVR